MAIFDIEKTALWTDIRDIITSGIKPVKMNYQGMLHTEFEDIPVMKIISFDLVRDYANNIGDVIHLTFKMLLGEYAVRLYPYRGNLEFSIKRTTLDDQGGAADPNIPITIERYKATFLVDDNPIVAASELEHMDKESLNKISVVDVKLQLLNRSLEPIRIKTVTSVYKKATPMQLIHALLGGESMRITIDGKPAIDGIDIVEPDNQEPQDHVVLPNGTLITSIPTFLQERMGGVYSTGIGNYLQTYKGKKLWFVYPLYRTNRFDKSKDNRVIIYALPQERFPNLDRTYLENGSVVSILASSGKKYSDSADVGYMNDGVGFRMVDARALMNKPVKITADGIQAERTSLNHEVAALSRKDGLNFAPSLNSGPSGNPFKEYSKINARGVARLDFIWEHANPDLLYPGMPCKYMFVDNGEIVSLTGTVQYMQSLTELQGNGTTSNTYHTSAVVTLLIQQKPVTRVIPLSTLPGDVKW